MTTTTLLLASILQTSPSQPATQFFTIETLYRSRGYDSGVHCYLCHSRPLAQAFTSLVCSFFCVFFDDCGNSRQQSGIRTFHASVGLHQRSSCLRRSGGCKQHYDCTCSRRNVSPRGSRSYRTELSLVAVNRPLDQCRFLTLHVLGNRPGNRIPSAVSLMSPKGEDYD